MQYKLSDPRASSRAWFAFIRALPAKFDAIVDSVFFTQSVCDRSRDSRISSGVSAAFCCGPCTASFSSAKSLYLHDQSRHGRRNEMRLYAPASGVCPVCQVQLCTRMRLMKHLTDKRRTACSSVIQKLVPPMSAEEVRVLDERDRASRASARNSGLSFVPSKCQARRSDGKMTGVCRF